MSGVPTKHIIGGKVNGFTLLDRWRPCEGQAMGTFLCPHCGKKFDKPIRLVNRPSTKSCGCLAKQGRAQATKEAKTIHGLAGHPVHQRWQSIKSRCYNPNHKSFKNYGGRGITVYESWINNFQAFYDYVTALPSYPGKNGLKKGYGLTLDRINNDGNYEPGNLRWVTQAEQCKNKRKVYGKRKRHNSF